MYTIEPSVQLLFGALLLVISFLYASVGHGGASGYLALMALFTFPVLEMKPIALVLNVCVSAISFWFFKRKNHFRKSLFLPFALSSIPMAFLGGYITVDATLYKQILGVFLVIAVGRMLYTPSLKTSKLASKERFILSLLLGGLIGFFSGMIGIGGGIILSPIIILLGWGTLKEAAAVSALFIFVNSTAGLIGLSVNGGVVPIEAFFWVPVVLIGGSLGALYGSAKFKMETLKYILAGVLILASIKLFLV